MPNCLNHLQDRDATVESVIHDHFTPHESGRSTPKPIVNEEFDQNWRGAERKFLYPTNPNFHYSTSFVLGGRSVNASEEREASNARYW